MYCQDLIRDLLGTMRNSNRPLKKDEVISELMEAQEQGFPEMPETDFDQIVSEVWQCLEAIRYLEKRFVNGFIPRELAGELYPQVPFNPDVLILAADEINKTRTRGNEAGPKIIALPKLFQKQKVA